MWQFGKGIYCSDAAVKAAQYGFTAVDRPEGFLMLAVVSLGDEVLQLTQPEKVCHILISNLTVITCVYMVKLLALQLAWFDKVKLLLPCDCVKCVKPWTKCDVCRNCLPGIRMSASTRRRKWLSKVLERRLRMRRSMWSGNMILQYLAAL